MKPLTREWVRKAEGDFSTMEREWRARKSPNYDAVCFHAQQCVEKYLKARLQEADIAFSKTHNLSVLLNLILPLEPIWEALRPDMKTLTEFAVDFRYPGETANKETAQDAVHRCRLVRREARRSLGLAL